MLQAELLASDPSLVHGFTTRTLSDDWRAICRHVGALGVARAAQVHGAGVLLATAPGPLGDGDAVVVTEPGLLAAVRVADCVPILLAGPGVVAAVHAGWRGTVALIAAEAVRRVCEVGSCEPDALRAVIGPCIAQASYEVGQEVLDAVRAVTDAPVIQGRHVDLKATNAALLRAAGVSRVQVLPEDTFTDPRFWSFRREGAAAGRQVGFIGLRS